MGIEKKLKNKEFNVFNTAVASVAFIVFSLLVDLFTIIPLNFFAAIIISILIEAVFLFASLFAAKLGNVEFLSATKLNKKIGFKSVLVAIAISVVCLVGFTSLTNVFMMVLEKIGYTMQGNDITITNFGTYILYVFLMALCPAVFEETLFRGTIFNGLREFSIKKAAIISALIFALMHGGPDQTVHQFILGIVCAYALAYSGSLLVPIIIHFFNNFLAVTMIYIQGAAETEAVEAVYSWGDIAINLIVAVGFAILALYLLKILLNYLKKYNSEIKNENLLVSSPKIEDEKLPESLPENSQNLENNQKKTRLSTTVLYAITFAYLGLQWILALINGFLR